jgi:DNA (cytosine-5)-methyltransferase 1
VDHIPDHDVDHTTPIGEPDFLLLENVRGISIGFGKKEAARKRSSARPVPFSEDIKALLEGAGYHVSPGLVRACDYGVPQYRPRWIVFGVHHRRAPKGFAFNPFDLLQQGRTEFLRRKGLPTETLVTVQDAISDLQKTNHQLIDCDDSIGFQQVQYVGPVTAYQKLLHGSMNGSSPNSMRLANHREHVRARFSTILQTCRRGVLLSPDDRQRLSLKKQCVVPLDGNKPAHTLTTLPDDFIHYAEPRILTVREYARLQSFPDWFAFKGKYTTGSDQRVKECPRYTQAANAVPPLLAEGLGLAFLELRHELRNSSAGETCRSTKTPE